MWLDQIRSHLLLTGVIGAPALPHFWPLLSYGGETLKSWMRPTMPNKHLLDVIPTE
jgi:hypothetical protein